MHSRRSELQLVGLSLRASASTIRIAVSERVSVLYVG